MKIDYREYGITYRQFDWWSRQGWIRPSSPAGSGNDREFPQNEVRIFRIIATLTIIGFKPSHAAEIARAAVDLGWSGRIDLRDKRVMTYGILSAKGRVSAGGIASDSRTG